MSLIKLKYFLEGRPLYHNNQDNIWSFDGKEQQTVSIKGMVLNECTLFEFLELYMDESERFMLSGDLRKGCIARIEMDEMELDQKEEWAQMSVREVVKNKPEANVQQLCFDLERDED